MSLLLGIYIANFLILLFLWISFLKKYFYVAWIYFFIFCVSTGFWFIFYLLTYYWSSNHEVLIFLAQISYATSLISLYSFLLFLYYFHRKKLRILNTGFISFLCVSCFLFLFYTLTPFIVEGLYYNELKQDWYEREWILFWIHVFLSLLFVPFSILLWYISHKKARYIDKKRIECILLWFLVFVVLAFIFLLILPLFGFWAMEKYIALFFIPFIFWVLYSTRRYEFLDIKIAFAYIVWFLSSLLVTFAIIVAFDTSLSYYFSKNFKTYWGIWDQFLLLELWVSIIIFLWVFSYIKFYILPYFSIQKFSVILERIKLEIPYITNITSLNRYLLSQFEFQLGISHMFINTSPENNEDFILHYFRREAQREYIINDIVFLEENKNKFWKHQYQKNSISHIYIIFPIRRVDWSILATVEIGPKSFWDPYLASEIRVLKNLVIFLQWHLKYLSVFKNMQELSISLDKQVDEKTIEYNNLLSKQKEFIAYVWHEIKNPITNSIFLCDSLRDDIWDKPTKKLSRKLQEDTDILYRELVKIADLVKHIFSTEQFDLQKVKLYKRNEDIAMLLKSEISIFISRFSYITFQSRISNVGLMKIDITQFRQVIHNLLTNAVKFVWAHAPRVCITACKWKDNSIIITIEDNGKWLSEYDIQSIFDKYMTWNTSSIWLWMGLYLCKKIIELHGWVITADKSTDLWWAKFTIIL